MDKIDTNAIKSAVDIVDVISRYIDLKKNGSEYQACCPFHDEKTPSFTVVPNKGFYHCFGCGEHGDVIDFVTKYTGCDFKEAAETLGHKKLNGAEPVKLKSKRVDPYEYYAPILHQLKLKPGKTISVINPKRDGKRWMINPQAVYDYGDQGCVVRTEINGKKITPMIRWCSCPDGSATLVLYPFDEPRPIYGYQSGSQQVLVVEGEKAKDHLQAVCGDRLTVVSWAGGSNGVDKTDWSPLAGRNVILWPDNDEPGFKTMHWLHGHLQDIAESVRCVIPDADLLKGWDGADHEWDDAAELFQWCKTHIGELPEPEEPKLPAPAVEAAPAPATSELDQAIMKLNESYSVVLNGDKVVIARRMLDESGAPEVRFLSTQSFHAYHANNQVLIQDGDKIKPVSVSQQWMKDLRRPTYDGVTFDPTDSSPDAYMNLWQGFAVVPSIDGSWDLLKAHIFDNICEAKQEYFDYIMTWMAQMLQQPKKKPGVMLVFRGAKGVGKSILSDNLQKLLGGHAVKISRADHLTGKFNAHMANRLLVAIEEGFWAGDKSADGPLKDLITSDNVLIEKKGFDPIKVRNCLRFLMTTNNDWVVPATKGDRRYAVFDVGDKQKQNRDYFNPITKQMENGGLEAMLYELLNWDLTKANLNDIPQTAALAEQKQQSFDSVEQWWFDVLGSGVIGRDEDKQTYNWPHNNDRISHETLHDAYIHYCRKMDMRHPKAKKAMLKQLRDMIPSMKTGVRLRQGERPWGVELPAIEQGRSDFDLYTGQENKW